MVDECRVCGPPPLTRVCKILLITNVAFWAVLLAAGVTDDSVYEELMEFLALTPALAAGQGHVWQLVTSIFLHVDPWHILFNMIGLYFFGPTLELRLGPRTFIRLFLVSGVVGSVCTVALAYLAPRLGLIQSQVLGASGAIFGLRPSMRRYPRTRSSWCSSWCPCGPGTWRFCLSPSTPTS